MISVGPVSVRAKDVAEKTQLLLTSGLFKEIAEAYEVALRVLLIFERAGSATQVAGTPCMVNRKFKNDLGMPHTILHDLSRLTASWDAAIDFNILMSVMAARTGHLQNPAFALFPLVWFRYVLEFLLNGSSFVLLVPENHMKKKAETWKIVEPLVI